MGSLNGEPRRSADEGPRHKVVMDRIIYMSVHEVTGGEFKAVMGRNPNSSGAPAHPANNVSWDDAEEFCEELSDKTGRTFRLPTEAEWEYACRAGTSTPFHTGDDIGPDDANFDASFPYGEGWTGIYRMRTTPAGSLKPNPWGLHDMHGNVWEWCADEYAAYPGGEVKELGSNSRGQPYRVCRGGCWQSYPWHCRSAVRSWRDPLCKSERLGFRVVWEPGEELWKWEPKQREELPDAIDILGEFNEL